MADFTFSTRMCSLWLNTSSFLTGVTCSVRVDGLLCFICSGSQADGGIDIFRTLLLFSRQVLSDSLRPHGLQHASPLCPSPSAGLPKFMSIELVTPSNHLILCHPLLLLPLIFPNMWPLYSGGKDWRLCIERGRDYVTSRMG